MQQKLLLERLDDPPHREDGASQAGVGMPEAAADDSPSPRPLLFVLALFVGAVAAAAGTTGAAAGGGISAHVKVASHHAAHQQVLLASPSNGRP